MNKAIAVSCFVLGVRGAMLNVVCESRVSRYVVYASVQQNAG